MLKTNLILTVPTDAELSDEGYRAELKAYVRAERMSERDWPDAIAEMFLRAYLRGIVLQYAPVPYAVPEIDALWGDLRFVRTFLKDERCRYPAKDRVFAIYRAYRLRQFTT